MYEEFYGFREKPFQIVPNPKYLYMSSKHEAALTYLEYGLQANTGFILLTGEIGSGKTTLINHLLDQIESSYEVAVLFNTNVTSNELFNLILRGFELEPVETDKVWSLEILYQYLISLYSEDKRAVLVIDEAQNLSKEALEEVRMLSNLQSEDQMLLQIMLVGQPELKIRLKDPGFAQFSQRIAVSYHLHALTHNETVAYIAHRLQKAGGSANIFSAKAIDIIHDVTAGIPRTINLVCDSALVYGFADEIERIDAQIIELVMKELGIIRVGSPEGSDSRSDNPKSDEKDTPENNPAIRALEDSVRKLQLQVEEQAKQITRLKDDYTVALVHRLKELLLKERKRSDTLLVENAILRTKFKSAPIKDSHNQNAPVASQKRPKKKKTVRKKKEEKPSSDSNVRSLRKV